MNHWRQMMDSDYVNSSDLTNDDGTTRDAVVTIDKVEPGEVKNESGKARKPIAWFQGHKKPLALNVTNCKAISRLYGNNPREWPGKRITLYVGEATVKGEVVPAIRVRPSAPPTTKGAGGKQQQQQAEAREPGMEG